MKKRRITAITACLLCLMLLFTACTQPGTTPGGEDTTRRTIPYAEMEYARPDFEAISARMLQLTEEMQNAASFAVVQQLDEEATELAEQFDTMHTLATLKKYHDVTDEYYDEEYRQLEDWSVEYSLLINDFNRAILDGAYAEDYRNFVGDYVYRSIEHSLLLNSPTVQDYKKERNQLNADYNQLLSTLTVTYQGVEYTMDDIYEVDSYALYAQLVADYYNKNAPTFTTMYARMVELDKLIAHELGFGSPAEMYYLSYDRDYTVEEALQLCNNVKTYFTPMVGSLSGYWYETGTVDGGEAFAKMPGALANVSEELVDAWDFMLANGLYDTDTLRNKQGGIAFTTSLAAYDAPFLFMNWTDDFSSLSTLIHEFGHFYDFWLRYDDSVVFNLDIAEVYSQGLELLMHEQYSTFGTGYEEARLENLVDMATSAIVYQSLLDEFQMRVYELDTFDSVVLGRLFAQLLDEYGMGAYAFTDENGADNTWFRVTHLFDSPFYTISYVTSAVAALQIWAESQQDWDAAAQTYLNLIHADQNKPFTELLEEAGLRAVHRPRVLDEIAGYYREEFGLEQAYAA
ncbi:hypothetical protein LJC04_05040 [Ruminococcaceae bacterium OttesenSCG-928-O06]|nr:hypothetical protein [Ruminococcaceae bacterium OttesenSCG-928-O06]